MPPLRVLGDRVLIRPDEEPNAPEVLDSGLVTARSLQAAVGGHDTVTSVTRGSVVAVGQPRHPLREVAVDLATRLERSTAYWPDGLVKDAAQLLRDLTGREPAVKPGDDVLFAAQSGQDVTIAENRYIILREHELLAVINGVGSTASAEGPDV